MMKTRVNDGQIRRSLCAKPKPAQICVSRVFAGLRGSGQLATLLGTI
jgi:hypothetical protein